jgi:peptidyl-prolyl cis-trans isomerase SurA
MNHHRMFAPLVLLALVAPAGAQQQQPPQAQPGASQRIDRIYALVGDSIIFESEIRQEVERALAMLAERKETVPTDSAGIARIRNTILNQMVEDLVLVQAALRDSSIVLEDDVLNAEVEKRIEARRQEFGGNAQFEAALRQQRLSLAELRAMYLAELRKKTLNDRLLQKMAMGRKPPPISDKELKEEFEKTKSTLPPRPPTVTFQLVVLVPTASDSARARARAKVDSILAELRAGADFATLAKRDSEDPGTRDNGGDLGWARPAKYVKEFADVIVQLRPGQISPVVETVFGFHIIKLEKVRSPEYQVRHILITPASSEGDVERALTRGREVAEKLRAGADADSVQRAIGDASLAQTRVGPVERSRLPEMGAEGATYAEHLANAKTGDVVGPFAVGSDNTRRVVVIKVIEVHEGGAYTIDDPVLNFRRQIQNRRMVAELIDDLKARTYIQIRQ